MNLALRRHTRDGAAGLGAQAGLLAAQTINIRATEKTPKCKALPISA